MKTVEKEDILEEARSIGLNIVETCNNAQGYPSGINQAILGFDTSEDAETFIKKHIKSDGELHLFRIRDGHHFFQDLGWKPEPLTCNDYINDLGDDWNENNPHDIFKALMEDLDFDHPNVHLKATEILDSLEPMFTDYIDMDKDNKVMICNGYDYEIVNKKMMSYSEDVYSYEIGVYLPKETED